LERPFLNGSIVGLAVFMLHPEISGGTERERGYAGEGTEETESGTERESKEVKMSRASMKKAHLSSSECQLILSFL
jgi:hypothetical protein